MTRVLMIDDATALTELFAQAIADDLGCDVVTGNHPDDAARILADGGAAIDVALVDLSFPGYEGYGIEALAEIDDTSPDTRLVIITHGDQWVAEVLRDAWELLPVVTVISKSAPLDLQLATIRGVLDEGTAPIDPAIRPLLPAERNPARTPESFRRLVPHAGHAKLWAALLATAGEVTLHSVASTAELKPNTIKNYRDALYPELELHGLVRPNLAQMRSFAFRCRPFLQPHIDCALGRSQS
ncbi:MAG: response regulator [Actinomycetota bacterium]